ncbi:MAG: CotH kinase family protein [Methanospirillaceae archaeon]|nr:CotH kinase family protein [Methanospirillaceae archaeon]
MKRHLLRSLPGSLVCTGFILCILLSFCTGPAAAAGVTDTGTPCSTDKTIEPDYETLFSDNIVHEITITIDPADWETMQEDLATISVGMGGFEHNTGVVTGGEPEEPPGFMDFPVSGNRTNQDNPAAPGTGMHGMGDTDPVYVPATIATHGVVLDHVGVRYKGCNSLQGAIRENSGKISVKLDMDRFRDEYPETDNQTLLGFCELNLQSNYNDESLLREKVVPEIFAAAGVVAPDTAFYRVYLDHGEGQVYLGLYTMVEAVEDTVIATQFADGSGNLYKPEERGATFEEGTLDTSCFEKKTNKKEDDYSDIITLYEILHSDERLTDPENWREELESVFLVPEFISWLATNTIIQNWDTYGGNCRNFYLYHDPGTGKFVWIPWDNNYALMDGMPFPGGDDMQENPGFFGNETRGFPGFPDRDPGLWEKGMPVPPGMLGNTTVFSPPDRDGMQNGPGKGMGEPLSLSLDEVGEEWPLIRFLMDDPVYRVEYDAALQRVTETAFNPETLIAKYTAYHFLIQPYVTGASGEEAGYSYLDAPQDFDAAFAELVFHAKSRYKAVYEYLKTTGVSP